MKIKIYVEGGSKGKLATECRKGFQMFFQNAGFSGRLPKVIACGPRNDAFKSFCTALKSPLANTLSLLLVDSESSYSSEGTRWEHLRNRDNWDCPAAATEDHVYLMVECMESWFLADRECLRSYFGQGFNDNSLLGNEHIETISKNTIFQSLRNATRHSETKGEYGKGKHSFDILGKIDPSKVRSVAPNADRLLKKLEEN